MEPIYSADSLIREDTSVKSVPFDAGDVAQLSVFENCSHKIGVAEVCSTEVRVFEFCGL